LVTPLAMPKCLKKELGHRMKLQSSAQHLHPRLC
jgi:hypothetical protein